MRPRPRQDTRTAGPDATTLRAVFDALLGAWGPQRWWPARTRFEMVAGAILTQNTAWTNVERAIARLRSEAALSVGAVHRAPARKLARWIRPAGYFNVKARRLKAFASHVARRHGGSLARLLRAPADRLRGELLGIHGIGPETADSILLYAARRPAFVVDAYTRRILARHGWSDPDASYDAIARVFTDALPADARLFNEYHALLVRLAKEHCRARPRCAGCPLERWRGRPAAPGRRARAAAAVLLAAAVAAGAGCAAPARRTGLRRPPPVQAAPRPPRLPAQGTVVRVHPGLGYVILECDVMPAAGDPLRLVRDGRVVARVRATAARSGAWVAADVVEGEPRPGDRAGPERIEKGEMP